MRKLGTTDIRKTVEKVNGLTDKRKFHCRFTLYRHLRVSITLTNLDTPNPSNHFSPHLHFGMFRCFDNDLPVSSYNNCVSSGFESRKNYRWVTSGETIAWVCIWAPYRRRVELGRCHMVPLHEAIPSGGAPENSLEPALRNKLVRLERGGRILRDLPCNSKHQRRGYTDAHPNSATCVDGR